MWDIETGSLLGQITLEKVLFANRRLLDDVPGLHIEKVALRTEAELNAMVLEMRAYVLASVREETPYTLSDAVMATTRVPERPVRDGLWLWLSLHVPWRLVPFFSRRVHWREIPTRRQVMMRHSHYYCCPHLALDVPGDTVHLDWLAEKQRASEN